MDWSNRTSLNSLPTVNLHLSPGELRRHVEDFKVTEQLLFEPTDVGEHLLLQVEKIGETTQAVQTKIASALNVKRAEIGYLGLKDKRSVAIQWFSVHHKYLKRQSDLGRLKVLQIRKHNKKLRRSTGCRNHFEIVVRDIDPESFMPEHLNTVPNYFGHQRFGRDGQNVNHALKWVVDKQRISKFLKGIYISSLRSLLFNEVLAERVRVGNWNKVLSGDDFENEMPTGPMWGRGRLKSVDETREIEENVVSKFMAITQELELVGLQQERRPLVLRPADVKTKVCNNVAMLSFSLPGGSYATSVLRECIST